MKDAKKRQFAICHARSLQRMMDRDRPQCLDRQRRAHHHTEHRTDLPQPLLAEKILQLQLRAHPHSSRHKMRKKVRESHHAQAPYLD